MKNFKEFIADYNLYENKKFSQTGVSSDIMKLTNYILSDMKDNDKKKETYSIKNLIDKFEFLTNWGYDNIRVCVKHNGSNLISYLPISNTAIIFMKNYSRSVLNHELFHAYQSSQDPKMLTTTYENKTLINQLSSFFTNNSDNINLLKKLIYYADNMEMGAYIHSFKKMKEKEKIELLTYILLLKYFDLSKLMSDKNVLSKFIYLWKNYYGETIPVIDRLFNIRRNIINSDEIVINKKELEPFINKINKKLNFAGDIYLEKLGKQNIQTSDVEKLSALLNKASSNIYRNKLDNTLNNDNNITDITNQIKFDVK